MAGYADVNKIAHLAQKLGIELEAATFSDDGGIEFTYWVGKKDENGARTRISRYYANRIVGLDKEYQRLLNFVKVDQSLA